MSPSPARPPIDTADIGLSLLAISQTDGPAISDQLDLLIGDRSDPVNLQNHLIVAVAMIRQLTKHAASAKHQSPEQFVARYRRELLSLQSRST